MKGDQYQRDYVELYRGRLPISTAELQTPRHLPQRPDPQPLRRPRPV